MRISTPTRTALAVGLATALAAPLASPASAAPSDYRFRFEIVGPVPTSTTVDTVARGISATGEVLVGTPTGLVAATPGRTRPLTGSPDAARPTMDRAGRVYLGAAGAVTRWTTTTPESFVPVNDSGPVSWYTAVGNPAGAVAGCLDGPYGGAPYATTFGVTGRWFAWPTPNPGGGGDFCHLGAGMSDSGTAVVTQRYVQSSFDATAGRAATVDATGVRYLHAGGATYSAADAISPDGRRIVGRVGADSLPMQAAFLSHDAPPVPLRFDGEFKPQAVTNDGAVLGVRDPFGRPRAVAWQYGHTLDLTTAASAPAGWVLTQVGGANEHGQIAATAESATTGQRVAVRLTLIR